MADYPIPGDLIRWNDMEMTQQHEGWRPAIYKDTKKKRTIGYGFNLDDPTIAALLPQEVVQGQRELSEKEASPIFGKLYLRARSDVQKLVGDDTFGKLPNNVKAVLTDMSYNMGYNKLSGFEKMIKAVQQQDWNKAGAEMIDSNWYKQVGDRSKKLHKIMINTGKEVKG